MIINSIVEEGRFVCSNNFSSYFFIQGDFTIELYGRQATYQTGHSYYAGDFSLPSNSLSFYDGDDLLRLIDESAEDGIDIDCINEELESDYTDEFLNKLLLELRNIVIECQQQVSELERELEQEIKDGKHVYVLHISIERDSDGEKHRYGEDYSLRFDNEEEAKNYISSNEFSEIVDAEIGLLRKCQFNSNF